MTAPLLSIQDLHKQFTRHRGVFGGGDGQQPPALNGVTFSLAESEILAVVGESGSGKSTLLQVVAGLHAPSSGRVYFREREITRLKGSARRPYQQQIQLVFQDPYESLNPAMMVQEIVAEPLRIHRLARDPAQRRARVRKALEDAGLQPAEPFLSRLPRELSGGQRQRVAIAAALVLEPALLLADEPVSMLDAILRVEILELLARLRDSRGLSVLLATHDVASIAPIADRMAVLHRGRIVESGATARVLASPTHGYTRALLAAIPVPDPRRRRGRVTVPDDEGTSQGLTPHSS